MEPIEARLGGDGEGKREKGKCVLWAEAGRTSIKEVKGE